VNYGAAAVPRPSSWGGRPIATSSNRPVLATLSAHSADQFDQQSLAQHLRLPLFECRECLQQDVVGDLLIAP